MQDYSGSYLSFRLTVDLERIKPIYTQVASKCDMLIVYEHVESCERPHIHGLIRNFKASTDTFKNWIRKLVHHVPATDWQFATLQKDKKTPVDINYITYMSKGALKPVYSFNIQEQEVEIFRQKWVDPKTWKLDRGMLEVSGNGNVPAKPKTITHRQIIAEASELLKGKERGTTRDIIKALRNVAMKHEMVLGDTNIRKLYYAYNMYYDKVLFLDQMVSMIDRLNNY